MVERLFNFDIIAIELQADINLKLAGPGITD